MHLKEIEIEGFKSFPKKIKLTFPHSITGVVGPNGSGKSNVTEAFRFVLGEQSMKNMRSKKGEDLIFNGGQGATKSSKASISITFNNKDHILHDSFDEVTITRTVQRDGTNEYFINDAQVRQRDIIEILAKSNVGATGHHIISQGEADRILNSSPEERKEIIEDGLGLKLLQYRKQESQKKIKKAEENLKEVDISLREITPQLKYLTRQVERYQKAKTIREELVILYAKYLANEVDYINRQTSKIDQEEIDFKNQIDLLETNIEKEKEHSHLKNIGDIFTKKTNELRESLQIVRKDKDSLHRKEGQIEGELTALTSIETTTEESIERSVIKSYIDESEEKEKTQDYESLYKEIIKKLKDLIQEDSLTQNTETKSRIESLTQKQEEIKNKIKDLSQEELKIIEEQNNLQKEQEKAIEQAQVSEKSLLELITKKNEFEQKLSNTLHAKNTLEEDSNELSSEFEEGAVLIGAQIDDYKKFSDINRNEERSFQRERRRTLERKKIELESTAVDTGEETFKEYETLKQRVEFLTNEKEDIQKSIKACDDVIEKLQKEIDVRFKNGISKISVEFEQFFKILFGGGKAGLKIEHKKIQHGEDEPVEIREGIGIVLSLPHKKVSGLEQLSGGERALVSIALLFAISQITPPPFLILDETDAALDEANSRRYGDMIEALSKKSQLILVTHNRETMHRAQTLYGVTMNNQGVSALLSIAFEDAVKVAK